jgi:hypothetical protein
MHPSCLLPAATSVLLRPVHGGAGEGDGPVGADHDVLEAVRRCRAGSRCRRPVKQ